MQELDLFEAICKGIDPRDGTVLDTPRDPDLDKARLSYLGKLRRLAKRLRPVDRAPSGTTAGADTVYPNKGKTWSLDDSKILESRWQKGETLDAISRDLGRTPGALSARLSSVLGIDRELIRTQNAARGGAYGEAMAMEVATGTGASVTDHHGQ